MDVKRSKELFHRAADLYHKQARMREMTVHEHREQSVQRIHEGKMSFARVLAVCGADSVQVGRFLETAMGEARSFHSPDTIASLLLAETMVEMAGHSAEYRSFRHGLMEEASKMRSYEVGRVHLPLAYFVRLAELLENLKRPREIIRELALSVLNRVEDTMEGAVRSSHWKQLQCSMLPIEPEVLSVCLVLDGVCKKALDGRANLLEMIGDQVRGISSAYAKVAVEFGKNQDERNRETER